MSDNKTKPTDADVGAFLSAVAHPGRREDAIWLDQVFRRVTGFNPVMWGETMVGYGQYHYKYESGREGDFLATGFSPRKANMVLYIMPGYRNYGPILDRLGKHKRGVSCLYLGRLKGLNEEALEDLIRSGLRDLANFAQVQPS